MKNTEVQSALPSKQLVTATTERVRRKGVSKSEIKGRFLSHRLLAEARGPKLEGTFFFQASRLDSPGSPEATHCLSNDPFFFLPFGEYLRLAMQPVPRSRAVVTGTQLLAEPLSIPLGWVR